MSKQSDNEIRNTLKNDENILKNIFGSSFRDKKIELEILKHMNSNIMLKNLINICYLITFAYKLIKGIFINIQLIFILQIILFIVYFLVCLGFLFAKNLKHKNNFDIFGSIVNYIYNIFQILCLIFFDEVLDLHFRTKTLFLFTIISSFEILLRFKTGFVFPILILIMNVLLYFLVYLKFEKLKENFTMILMCFFIIVIVTLYKRNIDEVNQKSFIQQHTFEKYYLYYSDLINNINLFHVSLQCDSIIKINDNLKIFLNSIKDKFICNSSNIYSIYPLLNSQLGEKGLIEEEKENKNPLKNLNKFEKINNSYEEVNCSNLNINIDNKIKFNNEKIMNEKIQIFMRLLKIKNIDSRLDINFNKTKINNLYDIFKLIAERKLNYKPIFESTNEKTNIISNLIYSKKNFNKNNEENFLINNIINFENESPHINKFELLGEFEFDLDKKIYQVFFQNSKEYDNIMDFAFYNITNTKEAEREKLEDQIKNKFFAKIAHELKTPINSIIGLLKNIKEKLEIFSINSEKAYSINQKTTILSEINLVESLSYYTIYWVNDIIDYSMSYRGVNFEKNIEEIKDIKEIIDLCKNILKSLLISKDKDKYIDIIIEYDPIINNNDYIIYSDPFRLKQILLNFISNSVKFTKTGYIKLKVEIKIEEKSINDKYIENSKINNNKLKISVIDTGLGLKEEEIKNIFNTEKDFYKKDYNKEGSGLGLSICKNIADILNHEIEVSSVFRYGSEFYIILDCKFTNIVKKYFNFSSIIENSSKLMLISSNPVYDSENNKSSSSKRSNNLDDEDISKKNNLLNIKYIDQTNSLQDISVSSNSSRKTQIIDEHNFNIDKKKISIYKFQDKIKINYCSSEISSMIDNDNNTKNEVDRKNLSQIKSINKKNNLKFNSDRSYSNKIGMQTNKEKLSSEKSINIYNNDIESNNSESKNENLIITSLHNNEILNNKDKNNSNLINKIYSMKEDFLFKNKILIVDDHKIVRDSIVISVMKCIKSLNKENEFEVIEGKDGIDILYNIINDQYNNNLIKCVITDENMEYINGSEAILILKNLENDKKIKNVVFASITAFQDEFSVSKIRSSGVDQILPKPCSEKMIREFLAKYVIL